MANLTVSSGEKDILGVLVSKKLLDAQKAEFIRSKSRNLSDQAKVLIDKKLVKEEDVAKAAASILNLPFAKIQGRRIDPAVLQVIPFEVAKKFQIVAFERRNELVKVAIGQSYRLSGGRAGKTGPLHQLEKQKGIKLELYATTQDDLEWALKVYERLFKQGRLKSPAENIPQTIQTSGLPSVDLTKIQLKSEIVQKFPRDIIEKYQIVLFEVLADGTFKIGMVDPFDSRSQEILNFIAQKNQAKLKKFKISRQNLKWVLDNYKKGAYQVSGSDQSESTPRIQPVKPQSSLPSGVIVKNGIYYLSEESIQKPQTNVTGKDFQIKGQEQNLEETNLDKFLGKMVSSAEELTSVIVEGFIPKIVAAILSLGVKIRASDIHLEAAKESLRLRYRIDGELRDFIYMPLKMHPPIASRIKILSGLKIDEQRIPQDGRYDAIASSHEIDVRVSSFPTVHGEKIVMRILDKTTSQFNLEELGLEGRNLKVIQQEIKKPWGVIVSTGPTGSGKSTTLYAILNTISNPKINVITLEDPVEYDIPGINQSQIKPKIGFSFAEGLRSVLRQDPNVIMVGEVRDSETANLVTHAALTGHLVLTTLHTNDAASTLPRLIDMKVEPYLITSSINAIIAQRLIRKLCPKCKQPVKIPPKVLAKEAVKGVDSSGFYGPGKGCEECHNGYKGRVGIFEVLVMTDEIERLAIGKSPASKIQEEAVRQGMIPIKQDGISKAQKGIVSLQDVIQATS